MEKYIYTIANLNDSRLENLLNERKSPMNQTNEDRVLTDLAIEIAQASFLLLATPNAMMRNASEVPADQIIQANLLQADDMKYLPVFTEYAYYTLFGMMKGKDDVLYVADIVDLYTFLQANPHCNAIVVNPGQDDLLLPIPLLKNLLQANQEI